MYGAIIGDIIGSVYEHRRIKTKHFPLFSLSSKFTDDSIMTVAVAKALTEHFRENIGLLPGSPEEEMLLSQAMTRSMREMGTRPPYIHGGYGHRFRSWLHASNPHPYGSIGNGSAMRVSPCGLVAESLEEALRLARISAEITHNSREGIRGAQAVAAAVYLAKTHHPKETIRNFIHRNFYSMDRTLDQIRPGYRFDATCQGSVPEAILAFLESDSFTDAIRNAVSLGGDADTQASIAGAIAWSYYRSQNGNRYTADMSRLLWNARVFMPTEFMQAAQDFELLCRKLPDPRDRMLPLVLPGQADL